ncbi:MAG: hypothetical protein SFT81_07110 [Candidatus Caenarcaniphilales bacterium]|nr:hypothetical protein [Candidatus Caenarcaniphilales bacterium]
MVTAAGNSSGTPTYKITKPDGSSGFVGQGTLVDVGGEKVLTTAKHVVNPGFKPEGSISTGAGNGFSNQEDGAPSRYSATNPTGNPFASSQGSGDAGGEVKVEKYIGTEKVGETTASVKETSDPSADLVGLNLKDKNLISDDPGAQLPTEGSKLNPQNAYIPNPKTGGEIDNPTASVEAASDSTSSNPDEKVYQVSSNPEAVGHGVSGGPLETKNGEQRVLLGNVNNGVPDTGQIGVLDATKPRVQDLYRELAVA